MTEEARSRRVPRPDGRAESLSTAYYTGYDHLDGDEKARAGIQDVVDWLGQAKFDEVTDALRREDPRPSLERFRFMASIAGVQGYPVTAWYEHAFAGETQA